MLRLEREEDQQVIDYREAMNQGNIKEVFKGLRPEILKTIAHDEDLFQVHNDLQGSAKVVNTWIYEEDDVDVIKQDLVPDSYFEVMLSKGLDHTVQQAVEIEESFLENDYLYRDLKPDNIRFHNGQGMAVDYLDQHAVQDRDNVKDMETALAKSYDLFVKELSDMVHGLEATEAEKLVDKHSNYTDARAFTGEPYIDFEYTGEK